MRNKENFSKFKVQGWILVLVFLGLIKKNSLGKKLINQLGYKIYLKHEIGPEKTAESKI